MATVSHTERVAVISGGSSGIGRSFVAALHAEGYRIFTCGRDAEKLRRVEQEFPGVQASVCDLADVDAIRAFAAFVQSSGPGVDLLISNAGVMREVDFSDPAIASAELLSEVEVNLGGPIQLIAAFMPALRAAAPSNIIVVRSYGSAGEEGTILLHPTDGAPDATTERPEQVSYALCPG
ncbi:MAG: SDR family NAD(P)-dependent oxidoreductase [Pseudomonadota bacterium]|nr:SDR family NAD(P)-dependent oxidoreductase [Pseudomonadota bacterium]